MPFIQDNDAIWLRAPERIYFPKEDGKFELQEDISYGTLIVEVPSEHIVLENAAPHSSGRYIWSGARATKRPRPVRETDSDSDVDNNSDEHQDASEILRELKDLRSDCAQETRMYTHLETQLSATLINKVVQQKAHQQDYSR